jgi:hypothetical protein
MSKGTFKVDRLDNPRRCTAERKRTGEPCGAWAIKGGNVCRIHGGGAGQTIAKARERLALAADQMAKNLLGIATAAESETTRLAATNSALDRAGVSGKTTVDVEVGVKPWEEVMADITVISNITRAEHHAQQAGLPAPELPPQAELPRAQHEPEPEPEPEPEQDNIIDAEVVPLLTYSEAQAALDRLPRPPVRVTTRRRRRGR